MARNKTVFQDALRRAHNFAWDRQWTRAVSEYQRALAEFDNDPLVWTSLGAALVESRRLPDARDAYRRASEMQPDNLLLQQKLAEIYEGMDEVESALQTYLHLAESLQARAEPDKAVDAWRNILRLQPAHIDARLALADLLEQLGRSGEAAQENVKAANLLNERGRTDQANERARRAQALDPRNAEARALSSTLPPDMSAPVQAATPPPSPALPDHESPLRVGAQQAVSRLAAQVVERGQQSQSDRWLARAIDQQSRDLVADAVDSYRRALASGASQPEIRFILGVLNFDLQRDDDAIQEFSHTLSDPQFALGSHFALAKCYRTRVETGPALEHLLAVLKAVESENASPALAKWLERFYAGWQASVQSSPKQEVVAYVDGLIAFMSDKGWRQKVGAWRAQLDALAAGDAYLSVAELLCTPAVDDVVGALSDSQTYLKRRMYATAVDECYRGIALAPTYEPLHARLAEIYGAQGRTEAAIAKYDRLAALQRVRGGIPQVAESYRRILSLAPEDVEVRARLLDLLSQSKQYAEAVEQWLALGQTYSQQSQPESALRAYQSALQLIPFAESDRWSTTVLHLIGEIHVQRLAWKEALPVYQQLRDLSPDDDKASLRLIEVCFKLGLDDEVDKELDRLIGRHEESGDLEMLLPVVSDMSGLRPRNTGLRRRVADLLLKLGRTEQAVSQLDALGDILLNTGQTREAIKTINEIIALKPRAVDEYRALLAQLQEKH